MLSLALAIASIRLFQGQSRMTAFLRNVRWGEPPVSSGRLLPIITLDEQNVVDRSALPQPDSLCIFRGIIARKRGLIIFELDDDGARPAVPLEDLRSPAACQI